jgi:hypothetical protein
VVGRYIPRYVEKYLIIRFKIICGMKKNIKVQVFVMACPFPSKEKGT